MRILALTILLTVAAPGPARAQAAGPNGGQTTVADGHPIEFVSRDREITFFVAGEDGKPLDTSGLNARAIVQAGGRTETVSLAPAAPNRLVGTVAAPLAVGSKLVLTSRIHGHSVQARFETK
ncbi:MAG: hypothetical protein K2X71_12130 [Methylobacterium sp.]|uniref:hypothetical protein n=1 Tax=Methylobacterium sp. TaxID=409 RepID=UPI0025832827|nr:hypothetical protein [Methylobacterium sp.]MBY0296770.1 hypothetical protein [Methylobacterium sp.]